MKTYKISISSAAMMVASLSVALETWGYGPNQNSTTNQSTGAFWKAVSNSTPDFPGWDTLRKPPASVTDGTSSFPIQPIASAMVNGLGTATTPTSPQPQGPSSLLLNGNGHVVVCGNDAPNYFNLGGTNTGLSQTGTPFLLKQQSGTPIKRVIQIPDALKVTATRGAVLDANGEVWMWGSIFFGNNANAIGAGLNGQVPHHVTKTTLSGIKQVALGGSSTFALTGDGKVLSFGPTNDYGILGRLSPTTSNPNPLDPGRVKFAGADPLIKQIDGGLSFAAALDSGGRVWVWGTNAQGQLGDPSLASTADTSNGLALQVKNLNGVKHIACTQTAGYALKDDGTVWGWGENGQGQLGQPPTNPPQTFGAVQIQGLSNIIGIWPMHWGAYFLRADGVVLGIGPGGQYSIPGTTAASNVSTPALLNFQPNTGINSSVIGAQPGLLIKSSGESYGWGYNVDKALGYPAAASTNQPLPFGMAAAGHPLFPAPSGSGRFKQIVTGRALKPGTQGWGTYSVGLGPDGTLYTVGAETPQTESLGNGSGGSATMFAAISCANVAQVDSDEGTTIALLADGTLKGFGKNPLRTGSPQASPVSVPGPSRVIKVATGRDHTLVLLSNGAVFASGSDAYGALGNGSDGDKIGKWSQVKVAANTELVDIIDITAAGDTSYALKADGEVWSWGKNNTGQLGHSSGVIYQQFARPLSLMNIKAIASGSGSLPGDPTGQEFGLALNTGGQVFSWGGHVDKQLGRSVPNNYDVQPKQLNNLGGVKEIGAGFRLGLALDANGQLWSWGRNGEMQLGTGLSGANNVGPAQVALGTWFHRIGVGGSGVNVFAHAADY